MADLVKKIEREHKINLKEFCDQMNINFRTLDYWLSGKHIPAKTARKNFKELYGIEEKTVLDAYVASKLEYENKESESNGKR